METKEIIKALAITTLTTLFLSTALELAPLALLSGFFTLILTIIYTIVY